MVFNVMITKQRTKKKCAVLQLRIQMLTISYLFHDPGALMFGREFGLAQQQHVP